MGNNWSLIYKTLAHADIFSDYVVLHDVRNFVYGKTELECIEKYATLTVPLASLISVSYIVVPFRTFFPPGGAHVFLSFERSDGEPLSISFEARRKMGQRYNPFIGLFPVYPLVGIVGTTNDLLTLRKVCRHDVVRTYLLNLTHDQIEKIFIELLTQANILNSASTPIFYNSLWSTCMTSIVSGFNKIIPKKIYHGIRTLLPGYSVSLLQRRGLIKGVQV